MSIIVIVIGLSKPVVTSLSGAGDVSKSVYDIAGLLEQSRAYAMASNTYVYVGFQEADANAAESGRQTDGVGRLSVAVFASKDGTRGYDPNNITSDSWQKSIYGTGGNFLNIGKIQHFNNIHLADLAGTTPPTSGNMARPALSTDSTTASQCNLANTNANSVTAFEYPLGNTIGNGIYTFNKVIQFDPQGTTRIQRSDNGDTIVKWMEIGLQQTHGDVSTALPVPAANGPIAAIQIDCMAGATHIYRP